MADPLRKRISDAMLAKLATITVANGWRTDIGLKVYSWLPLPLQVEQTPSVNLMDESASFDRNGRHRLTYTLNYKVVAVAAAAENTGDTLVDIHADLMRWVNNDDDHSWGGLVLETVPANSETTIQQQESVVGAVVLHFSVVYVIVEGDEETAG